MHRPAHMTVSEGLFVSLVAVVLFASSCAWGYAGQTEDEDETAPESSDDPNVVEVADDAGGEPPDSTSDETARSGAESSGDGDRSPCGVETFEIHYFDDSSQVTKEIHCARREVLEVKRNAIDPEKLHSAEQAGLPKDTWYLLVDPEGVRSTFLNNDQLIRISQEYDVQFLGRDEHRDLLIYEYRGNL